MADLSRHAPLLNRIACVVTILIAFCHLSCAAKVVPTTRPWDAALQEFWERPKAVATCDLFAGPSGAEHAPDPNVTDTFVAPKEHGTNPGVTVKDPLGREWRVKQAPDNDQGAEGPVEVVLSRVLSAVGYHQPPVYFLRSFRMADGSGVHVEPGGRFRLDVKSLKHIGQWSWQRNPFVGMRPYQGLLVILMMFNSSDLKNANKALYEVRNQGEVKRWYVVRDLGTALGETGRIAPRRSNPELFERLPFITGIENGFVRFAYHGRHQELFERITPDDVAWASELIGQLSDRQWSDAFRAGGYQPPVADRFIRRLHQKISDGRRLGDIAFANPRGPRFVPLLVGR